MPPLKEAGANSVYSGEAEVALAFIEDILDGLGATAEQIDRERARTHDEMYSGASFRREPSGTATMSGQRTAAGRPAAIASRIWRSGSKA